MIYFCFSNSKLNFTDRKGDCMKREMAVGLVGVAGGNKFQISLVEIVRSAEEYK